MAFSMRRSLTWMALSQGGLFVMQFGTSLVIARLLSPYEMGVFTVAFAIVGLLTTLRALGLSGYVIRATDLTAELLASVFTVNVVLAVLVSAMIAGLSILGGALLAEPGVRRLLLVMAILPLISIFEFLPTTGIERLGDFRSIALINLMRTFAANAVTLGFAFEGFSYMSPIRPDRGGVGGGHRRQRSGLAACQLAAGRQRVAGYHEVRAANSRDQWHRGRRLSDRRASSGPAAGPERSGIVFARVEPEQYVGGEHLRAYRACGVR